MTPARSSWMACSRAGLAVIAVALAAAQAPARAAGSGSDAAAATKSTAKPRGSGVSPIASCIEGSPPLRLAAGDRHALLDSEDREAFEAAALTRFPVLDRDGFAAVQILLWGKGDGSWMYVALQPAAAVADADAAGAYAGATGREPPPCFTAVFVGGAFEFTPELVRKYFKGLVRI